MKVVEKLQSLQGALDDFKMEIRSQGEVILLDAAKEVFDEVEGLTKFFCRGYTPSFDNGVICTGDPCTDDPAHPGKGYWLDLGWSNSYDTVYRLSYDGGVEEELDFFDVDFGDQAEFNSAEECPPVKYANSGVVDGALATLKVRVMAQLCDVVCHTNYRVFFTKRDDGEVDVVYADSDIDYEDYDYVFADRGVVCSVKIVTMGCEGCDCGCGG